MRNLRNTHWPVMGRSVWVGTRGRLRGTCNLCLHSIWCRPGSKQFLTPPGRGTCCAVRLPSLCKLFPFFSASLKLIQTFGSQLNIISSDKLARPPTPSSCALTRAPDTSPSSRALFICAYGKDQEHRNHVCFLLSKLYSTVPGI